MILINEGAAVSCYVDTAALLAMILLILLSERFHRRKDPSTRVFRKLCLTLTATCVLSFICHTMYMQTAPWCHIVAIAGRTLWEWLAFLIIFLWAAYVERKLYGARELRFLIRVLYNLPFLVFTVSLIVNLFTGSIFTCTKENLYVYRDLYYFWIFVEVLYFVLSLFRIRSYNNKATKVCFIRVMPMLIPVFMGTAVQFVLPCQADVLGFAIGALLLYSSMADEIRCLDEESGLYNKKMLAYLFDLSMAGKYDVHSALILEMNGNLQAGYEILRNTLHRNGDVIRTEKKKFLLFSGENNRSALQYLSSLADEAVVKHNTEHPEEKVQIAVRYCMRTGGEDSFEFLRTVMDEKETGDEMKGVVSMISELDRLDQELKLAADIQLSVLPMNFPAFPERTEFDLYASMMPAKEVGGDFYDFFLIDRDHLGMVIADVSGKGIPAALFMMVSKTLIKNQLMSGCDPATALSRVNLQLCERNTVSMFVTVWVAVVEISTGKGMACNAGHENPCLRRAGGDFGLLKYKHNMFAGISKKAQYQNREFELHPGDCIFVYTDGVPEATDATMKMFGEERLKSTLNQNAGAEPEELVRRVCEELNRFADGTPQFDDITMLCLKYYGTQNDKED